MTPEEFQRLKEAEKEHLRKLRALKQQARTVGRTSSAMSALERMKSAARDVIDTGAEMLDKLNLDTFQMEARTDMVLDASAERKAEADLDAEHEAAIRKQRAEERLKQMKLEMGLREAPGQPEAPATETAPEAEAEDPTQRPDGLPEKTLGRMKPGNRP